MGDVSRDRSSQSTRVTNSEETNITKVSSDGEFSIRDTHDNGGLDTVLNLTTTPQEGKVGATVKANRKYVIMEALDKNIKWGFDVSSQSFDLFKSQLIMVPLGENTEVWFKMSTGTGDVAFGELS